jgi:hypothetical protein
MIYRVIRDQSPQAEKLSIWGNGKPKSYDFMAYNGGACYWTLKTGTGSWEKIPHYITT